VCERREFGEVTHPTLITSGGWLVVHWPYKAADSTLRRNVTRSLLPQSKIFLVSAGGKQRASYFANANSFLSLLTATTDELCLSGFTANRSCAPTTQHSHLHRPCYMSCSPNCPNSILWPVPVAAQGSSVNIVSDYGLDNRAIEVRFPAGAKDFFSSFCPHRLWGPPSLLYNWYRGSFPRG
jgi:hypothetical protein